MLAASALRDFSSKNLAYCTLWLISLVIEQAAVYRGKENEKWRYAAKFIPVFQEKHRRIPLIEYKFSL